MIMPKRCVLVFPGSSPGTQLIRTKGPEDPKATHMCFTGHFKDHNMKLHTKPKGALKPEDFFCSLYEPIKTTPLQRVGLSQR